MVENHLTRSSRDPWRGAGLVEKRSHHHHERRVNAQVMGYIRRERIEVRLIRQSDSSPNQATQPAAVPTGRKRRRASSKKNEDPKAQDLDTQATHPTTSELVVALKALPRAEDPPPPPPQTVNELMDCTLKDYEEECVEEGTVPSELTTEEGEWEDQELNQMELKRPLV